MITLITGAPATGKTLRLKQIVKHCEFNSLPYFFNDTKNVNLEDLIQIKKLPANSYVLLDELSVLSITTTKDFEQYLLTHRHLGHEIYLTAQDKRHVPKNVLYMVTSTQVLPVRPFSGEL